MADSGSASPELEFYPQFCFHLSPTAGRWCHLQAADIAALTFNPGFEGQDVYFYLNHPIKWARIAGVVVAIQEFAHRIIYTIDDSSGATIECVVATPPQYPAVTNYKNPRDPDTSADGKPLPKTDGPIDIGHVIDIKGGISVFRDVRQIRAEKITHLRTTEQEAVFWQKIALLRKEVLCRPWVVDPKEVRKLRREEEGRVKKSKLTGLERESKRRKLEEDTVVEGEGRPSRVSRKTGLEKGTKSGGVLVAEVATDGRHSHHHRTGLERRATTRAEVLYHESGSPDRYRRKTGLEPRRPSVGDGGRPAARLRQPLERPDLDETMSGSHSQLRTGLERRSTRSKAQDPIPSSLRSRQTGPEKTSILEVADHDTVLSTSRLTGLERRTLLRKAELGPAVREIKHRKTGLEKSSILEATDDTTLSTTRPTGLEKRSSRTIEQAPASACRSQKTGLERTSRPKRQDMTEDATVVLAVPPPDGRKYPRPWFPIWRTVTVTAQGQPAAATSACVAVTGDSSSSTASKRSHSIPFGSPGWTTERPSVIISTRSDTGAEAEQTIQAVSEESPDGDTTLFSDETSPASGQQPASSTGSGEVASEVTPTPEIVTQPASPTSSTQPTSTTGLGDTTTVSVITSVNPSGTLQILPTDVPIESTNTGTIPTDAPSSGYPTSQPLITSPIPSPTELISATASVPTDQPSAPSETVSMIVPNIFAAPISTDPPPSQIPQRKDHPAPRIGIKSAGPIGTNKFYNNFFLGNQTSPSYLFPYSVTWARGGGASGTWGMAISHVDASQRVYGQNDPGSGAARYYINPIGIHSVCLSAKELGPGTVLTSDNLTDFSSLVSLRAREGGQAVIQFPLVQGAGFVTAVYNGGQPVVQTGIFFKTVTRASKEAKEGVVKYRLHLEDGTTWLVYAYHTKGEALNLQVVNNGRAESTGPFYGIVQVAKTSDGESEKVYDQACGTYAVGVDLSGGVNGKTGTYRFGFRKQGMYQSPVAQFALPHHLSSFDDGTRGKVTGVKLQTPTKGVAYLVLADSWTMVETELPTGIGFLPWSPEAGEVKGLSEGVRSFVKGVALQEVSQDMLQQSDQNSMYFSGKALAKFASIILVIRDMLGDEALALTALNQLKQAFARFAENRQQFPLVYEGGWGGVVSSASYVTGNSGADFGNSYYNDHHFHYGYFILTAAIIGHLDPSWIPANKAYVNMLVRDVANPSAADQYFPVWRNFDWYHGHSWAHGLFDTLDGKDQESSSEDTMASYALKMWGTVSGDQNLAARGNLMLAVQARSLNSYYLYTESNTVQPKNFIGNKVAGILFENKVDHTTYFGTNIEYVQGIHMLPLLPHTPMVRRKEFVREEWDAYFSGGRAEQVTGGWKGILMGNYGTIDPRGGYDFFSGGGRGGEFKGEWLDGGASLTWYLAYCAALGGL
ncbi:endo-1,3-beta glucanase [Podospora pseudopauciseta]|uniref:glucan endo-1,3-beta-D-glucosidase n=1 Tax=Podospora pseudopauciseta TaxID=2093780 RepID=A0ABR0HDK5_9PEZI|nr:endo-1,3-beta glucanase [Podospora pseudopauciseta]